MEPRTDERFRRCLSRIWNRQRSPGSTPTIFHVKITESRARSIGYLGSMGHLRPTKFGTPYRNAFPDSFSATAIYVSPRVHSKSGNIVSLNGTRFSSGIIYSSQLRAHGSSSGIFLLPPIVILRLCLGCSLAS